MQIGDIQRELKEGFSLVSDRYYLGCVKNVEPGMIVRLAPGEHGTTAVFNAWVLHNQHVKDLNKNLVAVDDDGPTYLE